MIPERNPVWGACAAALALSVLTATACQSSPPAGKDGANQANSQAKKDAPTSPGDGADEDRPATQEEAPPKGEGSSPSGSPLGGLGAMSPLAKMFASKLDEPGPYEERRKSDDYADDKPHELVLEWSKPIDELESISLLSGETAQPLRKLTETLREAAQDANVTGVVVRTSGLSMSMAVAEELRTSMVAFRASGKKLRCHTERIAGSGYYVLSACDQLAVAPAGEVQIGGVGATPVHVKGLMDKLGVQPDFVHIGAYKGAAEPITRDAPSPQMMEALGAILDDSYASLVAGVSDGRGLSEEETTAAIDQAVYLADEAKAAKLVDEVAVWEDFLAASGQPWKLQRDEKGSPLADFSALQRFIGLLPPERPTGDHVALVYAVGNVIDGKGSGIVGARQEIASRTLVSTLRALAKDESVKAVVLRVSSPGGSALASEQIWHAVDTVKKAGKPVVVSMGAVAASGGYYIACNADRIFAMPNTITGSIGVVGGKIAVGRALEKFGVKNYEIHRGERAMMWSVMTPWTKEEREVVQGTMQSIYDVFVGHVADGRGMDTAAVHAIAQGRVWTGEDAKENGLVDELGGLDQAIAHAYELAGIDAGELEVYPGDPTLRDLISSFSGMLGVRAAAGERASAALSDLAALAGPGPAEATAKLLATVFALRDARAWAITFVPLPM